MSTKKPDFETTLVEIGSEARPSLAGLQGLSDLAPYQVERLWDTWTGLAVERRRWLATTLAELTEDNAELEFSAVFKAALADEDAEVRAAAADGLWEVEDWDVAERLLVLLVSDPSVEVRAAAASTLGHFAYLGEMEEIPAEDKERIRHALLAAAAGEEPLAVRRRAVEAVGFISGDPEVQAAIERAYASADEVMRTSAVFAMGRNCDPHWLPLVIKEMESEDPRMRFEAARASGEIEDRRALPRLLRLLVDPDMEVRLAAIQALGTIGGENAIQALRLLTDSEDEGIAEAAEEALAEAEFAQSPLDFGLDDVLHDRHDHEHDEDKEEGEDEHRH